MTRALLPLVALLLFSGIARAQPSPGIFVWGLQSGCTIEEDLSRQLTDGLARLGFPAKRLRSGEDKPLTACPGAPSAAPSGCAQVLRSVCGQQSGVVLGGLVTAERSGATRYRMWLVDLASGRLAVQDDYCEQCDPDQARVALAHAQALLQAPAWGTAPDAKPAYCSPASRPSAPGVTSLYLMSAGSAPDHAAVTAQIQGRLRLLRAGKNQPPQRLTSEGPFDRVDPGQVVQVLRMDTSPTKVKFTLWDSRAQRVADRTVPCPRSGCLDALEGMAEATAALTNLCFADRCAQTRTADAHPTFACPALAPEGAQICPSLATSDSTASSLYITPRLGTALQAVTGTLAGVSLATAIGLWAANPSYRPVGDVWIEGESLPRQGTFENQLRPAATVATVAAGLLVGLSVTTIPVLARAKKGTPPRPSAAGLAAPISCPRASAPVASREGRTAP